MNCNWRCSSTPGDADTSIAVSIKSQCVSKKSRHVGITVEGVQHRRYGSARNSWMKRKDQPYLSAAAMATITVPNSTGAGAVNGSARPRMLKTCAFLLKQKAQPRWAAIIADSMYECSHRVDGIGQVFAELGLSPKGSYKPCAVSGSRVTR